MSKKEEGKLAPVERIQLKMHLGICDFCTRFQKQTKLFTGRSAHLHEHLHRTLSDKKKQEIKSLLKD